MSRIKGKDTGPEKIVRSLLHRMGFRFRCHQQILISLNENQVKKRLEGIRKASFVKPDISDLIQWAYLSGKGRTF